MTTAMDFSSSNKNKYDEIKDSDVKSDSCHSDFKNNASKFVFACAVFASLNSILLGYDVGVMSGAVIFIQEDMKITQVQEEVLVGILSLTSIAGSLAGGRGSDAIGRKWTMATAALVFQTGALVMALAPSFEILLAGRVLAGVGTGVGVTIAPVYIAEISPSLSRGHLTSLPEIFINLGILLGYVSNYAFSGLSPRLSWRLMLAAGILPSLLISFSLLLVPESPRWLVMRRRVDEARLVLLRTNPTEREADDRLAEIQAAASGSAGSVWRQLLRPPPPLRRALLAGCGIQCLQQITGIDATVYYTPAVLREAGMTANSGLLAATVGVGLAKTAFLSVPLVLIDRVGRKPLLYVSTAGMTVCLFCLGLTLSYSSWRQGEGRAGAVLLAVVFVYGYVAFFSVGIGPVCWVISSEIFPMRLRAQAVALGSVGNRVCSGLIAMSFLSTARLITYAGTFFVFSVISALSVGFVLRFVPETKGRTLEEIQVLFRGDGEEEEGGGEVEISEGKPLKSQP